MGEGLLTFAKYFEVGPHVLNVFHSGRSTLPGVPPDLGRGRVILFLHGAGSNGAIWRRQLAHFAADHSPLAFDLPGHGRSSGVEGLASVGDYAEVTLGLVDRLGVRTAVLAGASMGGGIALELALRAPERVEALVLISTAARFGPLEKSIETWRGVALGRSPQPFTTEGYGDDVPFEILREGWAEQVKTDPRVRYTDLLACQKMDLAGRLGEVRARTLVVAGTKDSLVGEAEAETLAGGIPGARRVVIEGGGHFLYREKPVELAGAIDGFLEER